jgi:hypothetical protein
VGSSGHRNHLVRFGELEQSFGESGTLARHYCRKFTHPKPEGSLYLVVSRATGMNFLSHVSVSFCNERLNRRVAVFILNRDGEQILTIKIDDCT